jgi:hypothetical protein
MAFSPERLAARLLTERDKNLEFFRAISDGDWTLHVHGDEGNWTVQHILIHITEAEGSVLRLIQHIIKGGGGVPEDFDLDRYNARKVGELVGSAPAELLDTYSKRRQITADYVRALSADQLLVKGRHPFLGIAQIEDIIKLMYRHVQLHQRDIRKKIKLNDPTYGQT